MYKYISDSNILSPNLSSVCTGDSCINQLLSVTHDIYTHLMNDLKQEQYFLIFQRPLIKFGTKDLFIDYANMFFMGDFNVFLD